MSGKHWMLRIPDIAMRTTITTSVFLTATVLFLAGCAKQLDEYQLAGSTMGTSWSVSLVADEQPRVSEADVQQALDSVEQAMSNWLDDSEISRFNAIGEGCQLISEHTENVIKAGLEISHQSQGFFDPTLAPLIELWGFGVDDPLANSPDAEVIEHLMQVSGYGYLSVSDNQVCKSIAEVHLNLSAIAKGYAVDVIAGILDGEDLQRYLVEVGGELYGKGLNKRGEPWQVGIESPDYGLSRDIHSILPLDSMAVATSGDYRNYYEIEGVRYSHILDPHTGTPVTHNGASVTVMHTSAMYADGWATALLVAGPDEGMQLAEELELPVLYISREGEVLLTQTSQYWPQESGNPSH